MSILHYQLLSRPHLRVSIIAFVALLLWRPAPGQINPYAETTPTPAPALQLAPVVYQAAGVTPIVVDAAVPVDVEVEALMEELREPLARFAGVICRLDGEISSRGRNGALGHMLAMATLEAAREAAPEGVTIDIAIMNSGGVRASLSGEVVTEGCLLRVMPFANKVLALKLDGEHRERFLQRLAEQDGRFLLAGARLRYTRNPTRWQLTTMSGEPWPQEPLVVALSDYLATGGDGMSMLRDAPRVIETDVLVRDALRAKILRITEDGLIPLRYAPPATMIREDQESE